MDCAIRTDDAMVSRHHARIYWSGGGYVLEDLSSANGVYFQEQRVQSHMFKHGDAIRCGSLWLRFVDQNQLASSTPGTPSPSPMMQHPGMGVAAPAGPTGHVGAINPAALQNALATPAAGTGIPPQHQQQAGGGMGVATTAESDVEIRVLRRPVGQPQAGPRGYRAREFNQDPPRPNGAPGAAPSMMEIERDNLKNRLDKAERELKLEAGSLKVKRALEIAAMTAEAAASLNDLLSSLRIEVMAAEGEFEQYAHNIPRASFELIRQSLKDAASHCDEARELLRKLREVAE